MKLTFPHEALLFEYSNHSGRWYDEEGKVRDDYITYLAVPYGSMTSIDLPSYWREVPSMHGHDICHVKMLGDPSLSTSSGKKFSTVKRRTTAANYSLSRKYNSCTVTQQRFVGNNLLSEVAQIICYKSGRIDYEYVYSGWYTSDAPPYIRRNQVGYLGALATYKNGTWSVSIGADSGNFSQDERRQFAEMVLAAAPKGVFYYHEITFNETCDWLDMASGVVPSIFAKDRTLSYSNYLPTSLNRITANVPSSGLQDALVLSEDAVFFDGGIPGAYDVYHIKSLQQAAYLDALDKIPVLNDNTVSNVLEIVSFLKGIILDHRVEIPRSLSSAWMAYRYSYTTTKLDVKEAVGFVHRTMGKDLFGKGFSCYGSASDIIKGVPVTCRCRFDCKQKELDRLESIMSALYRYGLSPSFYIFWDMVPYSFIVDWFIPVGDILSGYDKTHMYDRTYDFSNLWFSLSYDNDVNGTLCRAYTRWESSSPPEFNGYYTLENKGTPSDKVIGFRILDTMSMIFG